jgi:adenine-specific DNA-methyltransferase
LYRLAHPLAERLLARAKARSLPNASITFDHTGTLPTVAALKPYVGRSGEMRVVQYTVESLDQAEDHILVAAVDSSGHSLEFDVACRLLSLPAASVTDLPPSEARRSIEEEIDRQKASIRDMVSSRNTQLFDAEAEKLDGWAEDLKVALERELREIDRVIKEAKRTAQIAPSLEEKLAGQRSIKALEAERMSKRRSLFEAQDAIELRRTDLIEAVEKKLSKRESTVELFSIVWALV